MAERAPHPVAVVGLVGGEAFGARARHCIDEADVLVGSTRHLSWFADDGGSQERIELVGDLTTMVERVGSARAAGRRVCVLSSGDPGFFGIVRVLAERLGSGALAVFPAPSSVSLAWATVGLSWDDADVVSAHGRDLEAAIARILPSPKVAVLTGPAIPPQVLGKELLARGCASRRVVVASRLGESDQQVVETDLEGLAQHHHDAMSVVLLIAPDGTAAGPVLSWGRPESGFAHRRGMITKAEVRSIVLGALRLPRAGVLWDVGAGSGSVGIEAATIAPGLRVYAVERSSEDSANIVTNAEQAGVAGNVEVIVASAPAALGALPDPDRVFVGGGGLDVVQAAWDRLPSGGVLVATFVILDRAVAARRILDELIQVHIDRGVAIGDAGMRLEPTNPVFVCWGTK